ITQARPCSVKEQFFGALDVDFCTYVFQMMLAYKSAERCLIYVNCLQHMLRPLFPYETAGAVVSLVSIEDHVSNFVGHRDLKSFYITDSVPADVLLELGKKRWVWLKIIDWLGAEISAP